MFLKKIKAFCLLVFLIQEHKQLTYARLSAGARRQPCVQEQLLLADVRQREVKHSSALVLSGQIGAAQPLELVYGFKRRHMMSIIPHHGHRPLANDTFRNSPVTADGQSDCEGSVCLCGRKREREGERGMLQFYNPFILQLHWNLNRTRQVFTPSHLDALLCGHLPLVHLVRLVRHEDLLDLLWSVLPRGREMKPN